MFRFRRVSLHLVMAFGVGSLLSVPAYAEISLDGTLRSRGSLPGPNFMIGADVGEQVGSNLFHSFGVFNASGEGGGSIFIRGGQLAIDNASVEAQTLGSEDGRVIDIRVTGNLIINNSFVSSDALGAGRGSNVVIFTDGDLMMSDGLVESDTAGEGDGGTLKINARNMTLTNGAQIGTAINDADPGGIGTGSGGDTVVVVTGTLFLSGANAEGLRSGIFASAETDQGNAGDLFVHAGRFNINDGVISGNTFTPGRGGNITIVTDGSVIMNGGVIEAQTAGEGDAGTIKLNAANVTLLNGAQIRAAINDINPGGTGTGSGGDISVVVTDRLTIGGRDAAGNKSGLFTEALTD